MTLAADEFIRRFLLHVLPDGFQRIRHYGFLANGHRRQKLEVIGQLLDAVPVASDDSSSSSAQEAPATQAPDVPPCPCCGGRMLIVAILPDPRRSNRRFDSS